MHKAASKQQKPKKVQKAQPKQQKRKIATKKVAKKHVATATTTTTTMTVSTATFSAAPAGLKFKPQQFATAAPIMAKSGAFQMTKKVRNEAPSPAKVIFQAQKFIGQDVESLSKELSPTLQQDVSSKGFSYTINNEGIITMTLKSLGYDVEFVYDREFEYADQDDEEEGQQQEEQQEGDEGKYAFHNITVTLAKNGRSLRLGGQIHLNGDLKIQTFTPYAADGTELRTVSTEDMSDGTVNSIFDALEVTCLSDETCSTLLEVGRQERLKTHLQSVGFIADFFGEADTM
jgi:hypothetical protein